MSRGPVTSEGKQRSGQNSLKHGLTARRITIPGEDLEEWMALCDSYFDVWQPVGLVEVDLVEAIASYAWRLRRAPGAEASAIRRAMAHRRDGAEKDGTEPMSSDGAEPDDLGDVFMDLDAHGFLSKALPRYEARLARQRDKTIELLRQTQNRRQMPNKVSVDSEGPL